MKKIKNMSVLLFDEATGIIRQESIEETLADTLETSQGVYDVSDFKRYIDDHTGHIYYVLGADQPAMVEAQNLKQLRRSTAMKAMFDYDRAKPLDIFKLMPYFIIILIIIFG